MKLYLLMTLALVATAGTGCVATVTATPQNESTSTLHARHTATPVVIDGELDDAVWRLATAYAFGLSRDKTVAGQVLVDHGSVQLAHDDEYLYVAFRFEDQDVVAEGADDQLHHYQFGDVAEVFIKPRSASAYWEL